MAHASPRALLLSAGLLLSVLLQAPPSLAQTPAPLVEARRSATEGDAYPRGAVPLNREPSTGGFSIAGCRITPRDPEGVAAAYLVPPFSVADSGELRLEPERYLLVEESGLLDYIWPDLPRDDVRLSSGCARLRLPRHLFEPLPATSRADPETGMIHISPDMSSHAAVQSEDAVFWRFSVSGDGRFTETAMESPLPDELAWDGVVRIGSARARLPGFYDYSIEAMLADGALVSSTGEVFVSPTLKEAQSGRYAVATIYPEFRPNSPELADSEENAAVIEALADLLGAYDGADIHIEGHAVMISMTEREQEEELIPLTRARAATVRAALIDAGLRESRRREITVRGEGGAEPVVAHTNLEERRLNRRVEVIVQLD